MKLLLTLCFLALAITCQLAGGYKQQSHKAFFNSETGQKVIHDAFNRCHRDHSYNYWLAKLETQQVNGTNVRLTLNMKSKQQEEHGELQVELFYDRQDNLLDAKCAIALLSSPVIEYPEEHGKGSIDKPVAHGDPAPAWIGEQPVAHGDPAPAWIGEQPVAHGDPAPAWIGEQPEAIGDPAPAWIGDKPVAHGDPAPEIYGSRPLIYVDPLPEEHGLGDIDIGVPEAHGDPEPMVVQDPEVTYGLGDIDIGVPVAYGDPEPMVVQDPEVHGLGDIDIGVPVAYGDPEPMVMQDPEVHEVHGKGAIKPNDEVHPDDYLYE